MKKQIPILFALFLVGSAFIAVAYQKGLFHTKSVLIETRIGEIGGFRTPKTCGRLPPFLKELKIPQPIAIDLTQQHHEGISFLHGQNLEHSLHEKDWEQFSHFGTYTLNSKGDIYLAPMPFISIKDNTFELQKQIYTLDGRTGRLTTFMKLEDVHPNANNPYGIVALDYDCDDGSLWVSAIDESDYQQTKGVIYHINPETKEIMQQVEGIDASTIKLLDTTRGKFLLVGSAREPELQAYPIVNGRLQNTPSSVAILLDPQQRIRKIKIHPQNKLQLQSTPFAYTLVAETSNEYRKGYQAVWSPTYQTWEVTAEE